jgi:hypothetical protein
MAFLFGASKDGGGSRRHERALARTIQMEICGTFLSVQGIPRTSPGTRMDLRTPKRTTSQHQKVEKTNRNRPQMFGIDRPAKQWVVAINVFDQRFSDWAIIFLN